VLSSGSSQKKGKNNNLLWVREMHGQEGVASEAAERSGKRSLVLTKECSSGSMVTGGKERLVIKGKGTQWPLYYSPKRKRGLLWIVGTVHPEEKKEIEKT